MKTSSFVELSPRSNFLERQLQSGVALSYVINRVDTVTCSL